MGCGASTAAPDKPVEEKTVDTKPVDEKPTATPTETAAAPATPAPSTGAQAPTHGPVGMVLSKAFAAFDVNGNGTLDKMELKRAFRAIGISKVDVEALWGEFDFDGDGAISLAEVRSPLTLRRTHPERSCSRLTALRRPRLLTVRRQPEGQDSQDARGAL